MKYVWLGIAVLLPLMGPAGLAQKSALQNGVELFRQGKYEAALQQFEIAGREHPRDATIPNFIGIIDTKLGRAAEADAQYHAAIELNPNFSDPHKNLGLNYFNSGEYEKAELELKTALDLNPEDAFIHYYLGMLYLATGRDHDAALQAGPAEALLEKDPSTAYSMAQACLRVGQDAQGLQLIDALEKKTALSVDQEYALAALLNQRKLYQAATDRFRRIVEIQPEVWQNHYNLALSYLHGGEQSQAIVVLKNLAKERPDDARILGLLGSAQNSAGDTAAALSAFGRALASDSANPDRYLDYTQVMMDLNRYDEATQVLLGGLKKVADAYPLNVRLGAIEMQKGNYAKAREYFQAAMIEHPEVPMAHVAMAQAYMKEGNNQEALKVLTAARATLPPDFALEYAYGLASFQQGDNHQAEEALESAERMQPDVVEPHYELGLLAMQQANWDRAKSEFEEVLSLDPQRANAYYQLSRTYAKLGDTAKAREMGMKANSLTESQREETIQTQKARLAASQPK